LWIAIHDFLETHTRILQENCPSLSHLLFPRACERVKKIKERKKENKKKLCAKKIKSRLDMRV
jgi:hypothetical protein